MPERIRRIIPIILILAIVAYALFYLSTFSDNENGGLAAAGTVEATQVQLSAETGGTVLVVYVDAGDRVEAGDLLVQLDDELLQVQRTQALAGVPIAEAGVAAAELALENAQQTYDRLFEFTDEPDEDMLSLAEAGLDNAQAQLAAAEAGVESAQAALTLIDLQIERAEIRAPLDGTVLYRSVEPGELAVPGAPLIVLAQLDDLTITVFLPEDRYGEVDLGDQAEVEVDSFPDAIFSATVLRIADEAEFTPRNVQTAEGRRTTVFAIELRLDDPEGRLKPGMPADVYFER